MRNLLWKEWHEQSWKLGYGCLVLGALAWIGLRSRITADETMMMWVCFLGLTLLPVLSSTGLIPAERSDGSFASLLSMPIAPWRVLLAKTVMGLILCAGPLIVAAGVSLLAVGGRELTESAAISLYFRTILTTLSLFIWMLALTVRLPNETRASLLAMGVLIFWMMATAGLARPPVWPLAFAFSPFSFVFGYSTEFVGGAPFFTVLLVQIVTAIALWVFTSRQLTGAVEGKP